MRDEFHVILVEPEKSLNIGAVARAMTNLGFIHLHLVAPREYDRATASVTACWGEPLLDTLQIHETFADALDGIQEVVALSGRSGQNPPHWITLPEWSEKLPERSARKTALVFGPEDNGLRQEHLDLCRWVVRIPAASANPSFNLAQSVLLVLYEITKTLPQGDLSAGTSLPAIPTENEYFHLDRLIESVMRESGFLRDGTPAPVPGTLKNLFRRLDMTSHEMGILLGLFGRINTNLKRGSGQHGPIPTSP